MISCIVLALFFIPGLWISIILDAPLGISAHLIFISILLASGAALAISKNNQNR